jgi:hypothetical protein
MDPPLIIIIIYYSSQRLWSQRLWSQRLLTAILSLIGTANAKAKARSLIICCLWETKSKAAYSNPSEIFYDRLWSKAVYSNPKA